VNSVIPKQIWSVLVVLRIMHAVVPISDNITDTVVLPLGSKYIDAKKYFFVTSVLYTHFNCFL